MDFHPRGVAGEPRADGTVAGRARVAGVVLAAGASKRMGRNKLLLELDGEPVVRRTVRQALEAGLSPVIVVLGFEAKQAAAALDGLPIDTAVNPRYSEGMHASLRAGIERVPPDRDAAVVILADMPLVSPPMLAEMVACFRDSGAPLVISLYGTVQAPPTLYARSLFPALLAAGAAGGRGVIREHQAVAAALHWPADLLADLDRSEDVARLRARLPDRGPRS